jgi:beta-mannosidase
MSLNKTLEDGWFFTQLTGHERNESANKGTDVGEWLPVKIPTGVHEELFRVSRIPDPFIGQLLGPSPSKLFNLTHRTGLNEHLVQWIGEEDWAFRTKIQITPEMHAMPHIDLVFDGLDTYATIELDGKKILEYVSDKSPARTHLSPLGRTICSCPTEFLSNRD